MSVEKQGHFQRIQGQYYSKTVFTRCVTKIQWSKIFKVLKEKNYQPRILFLAMVLPKSKRERKIKNWGNSGIAI